MKKDKKKWIEKKTRQRRGKIKKWIKMKHDINKTKQKMD